MPEWQARLVFGIVFVNKHGYDINTTKEYAMNYDEIFAELLEFMDFRLYKEKDGYALLDLQKANLGDIESDRFETAEQVIDRMDVYVHDYLLDDEVWGSYSSCKEALEKAPNHALWLFLDLIINHIKEVKLENVAMF